MSCTVTFAVSAAEAMDAQIINFRATVVACMRVAESGAKAKTNSYRNDVVIHSKTK